MTWPLFATLVTGGSALGFAAGMLFSEWLARRERRELQKAGGTATVLRSSLAPPDCDRHDNARVVSLLAVAAADAAARFHDRADLGNEDSELRWQWGKVVSLLNDVGEWASPAAGLPDEPGELHVDTLAVVFAAHRQKWEEYEESQPE